MFNKRPNLDGFVKSQNRLVSEMQFQLVKAPITSVSSLFTRPTILKISLIIAGTLWSVNVGSQVDTPVSGPGYSPPTLDYTPAGNSFIRGKLTVYPEFELGVVYDDNIFLDSSEEVADEIIHAFPRLLIDYSLQDRGNLSFSYTGNYAFYNQYSDNNWQRHNFGLMLDYQAPSGLVFNVVNSFVDTSDPFGSRDVYELGQQKERWFNMLGVSFGYVYADKLKVLGYINYNLQEYDNSIVDYSQNFDDLQYGLGLEKRLTEKMWGFIRYFQTNRDFNTGSPDGSENETNDADYISNRFFMGLNWDLTSRITGELNLGYEDRVSGNPVDFNSQPYEDEKNWLAVTNINYALKPDVTDLGFRLERGIYSRGSNTADFFVDTDFTVALEHRFYSWYKVNVYLGLEHLAYNSPRTDYYYRGGARLEYLVFRRFTLAAGYDYYRRNSDLSGESFTDNRLMLTLTARY